MHAKNEMKNGANSIRALFLALFSAHDFFYIPFHSAYSLAIAGPIVKPHA